MKIEDNNDKIGYIKQVTPRFNKELSKLENEKVVRDIDTEQIDIDIVDLELKERDDIEQKNKQGQLILKV